jgi:hypothetical protein
MRGEKTAVIAKDLRVSEPVRETLASGLAAGRDGRPRLDGPPEVPKLSDGQFAELEEELALGPAEHGSEDQRWTVAPRRRLGSEAASTVGSPSRGLHNITNLRCSTPDLCTAAARSSRACAARHPSYFRFPLLGNDVRTPHTGACWRSSSAVWVGA